MRVRGIRSCVSRASRCLVAFASLWCWAAVTTSPVRAERFKTVGGEVVIEAEAYTRLAGSVGGSWSVETTAAGYRGSGYIRSATDDPSTLRFNPATIRAEYDIRFEQSGTYYLHLRSYAEDITQNGFFATIDGVQFDYGHADAFYARVKQFESSPRWWWYTDGGGAGARGYKVSFDVSSTGTQTLAIVRRDKGSRVDRIWLTKHQSTPQDSGTLALPAASTFIVGSAADAGGDAPASDAGATLDAAVDASEDAVIDGTTPDAAVDAIEDVVIDGTIASDGSTLRDGAVASDTADTSYDSEVDGAGAGQGSGTVSGGCGCKVAATGFQGVPLAGGLLLIGFLRFVLIGFFRLRATGKAPENFHEPSTSRRRAGAEISHHG